MGKLLFLIAAMAPSSFQVAFAAQMERLNLSTNCSCQVKCINCRFQTSELNLALQLLNETREIPQLKKMLFRDSIFSQQACFDGRLC